MPLAFLHPLSLCARQRLNGHSWYVDYGGTAGAAAALQGAMGYAGNPFPNSAAQRLDLFFRGADTVNHGMSRRGHRRVPPRHHRGHHCATVPQRMTRTASNPPG